MRANASNEQQAHLHFLYNGRTKKKKNASFSFHSMGDRFHCKQFSNKLPNVSNDTLNQEFNVIFMHNQYRDLELT